MMHFLPENLYKLELRVLATLTIVRWELDRGRAIGFRAL
jgi:hypothetical protein